MPPNDDPIPSITDLESLIELALDAAGHSPDWIAGFIAAERIDGCLRDTSQIWKRRSAAARFATMLDSAERKKIPRGAAAPGPPASCRS